MTRITVPREPPRRATRVVAPAAWLLQILALWAAPAPAAAREPLRAEHGVVSSASRAASEAGVAVLKQGGNAVDAAVATALALAVTWPSAGNLAGGGFMLIRLANGTATFIDYRETAPAVAFRESYLDSTGHYVPGSSLYGPRAAGVPGTVPGLAYAFQHYGSGKVSWAQLVEPARRLAAEGYAVTPNWIRPVRADSVAMARDPETRRIYLQDGRPWRPGDVFTQPELAATLARLAKAGPAEFTTGETARRIASTCRGWITLRPEGLQGDRARLQRQLPRLRGADRPPPSSGGLRC
jgi:gamma-glutamyltranspeptidase/glutathione hydrolase